MDEYKHKKIHHANKFWIRKLFTDKRLGFFRILRISTGFENIEYKIKEPIRELLQNITNKTEPLDHYEHPLIALDLWHFFEKIGFVFANSKQNRTYRKLYQEVHYNPMWLINTVKYRNRKRFSTDILRNLKILNFFFKVFKIN